MLKGKAARSVASVLIDHNADKIHFEIAIRKRLEVDIGQIALPRCDARKQFLLWQ